MNRVFLAVSVIALAALGIAGARAHQSAPARLPASASPPARETAYSGRGLLTDTSVHSIPLEEVLDGGPGKDGIPALVGPKFTTISGADKSITDSVEGILVSAGSDTRFYPYNILVWHEVVNDTAGGVPLVVTFCPLCGSAIVYDARVGGKPERFGVSGKLYNSNLLMYDKTTESLWSQIEGKAVVGALTGVALALYPSQVVPFKTVRERYPQAKVLSTDTGYRRDYSFYPYGDYNTSGALYFPVSVTDTRLPAKEIMYVVNWSGHSIAFKVSDMKPGVVARVDVDGAELTATMKDGLIEAVPSGAPAPLPGYHAMWFSWAAYHQKDGIAWTAAKQL